MRLKQQGKELGKALRSDALKRIAEAADIVAVRSVMVHAIDEAARRFYEHFEFEPAPVDPSNCCCSSKISAKRSKQASSNASQEPVN
jgi:hypothetical protein